MNTRWSSWLPLVLLTGLAAAMRLSQVRESLWLDELHTAWVVADGPGQIAERARLGNTSSLFFLGPWLTSGVFGLNEFALRLPSVIAGTLLVPLAYWLVVRGTASRAAGWLAAGLVAVDRNCLFFGQEARVYAAVQLVGLLHIGLLARLISSPSQRLRVAWVVVGGGLFYLHYTAGLLFLGELTGYGLCWLWPGCRPNHPAKRWSVDVALLAVLCLPAWPHLREIAGRHGNWELFVPTPTVAELLTLLHLDVYLLLPLAILAVAAFASTRAVRVLANAATRPNKRHVDDPLLPLLLACVVVPVLAAWVASHAAVAQVFLPRYLIAAATAATLLAAMLHGMAGKRTKWLLATVLLVTVVWQAGYVEQARRDGRLIGDRDQDWRAAVRQLNHAEEVLNLDLPVLLRSGLIEAELPSPVNASAVDGEFRIFPVRSIYRLRPGFQEIWPLAANVESLSADMRRRIVDSGGVWLLVCADEATAGRIEAAIVASLRASVPRVDVSERLSFGSVRVIRVTIATPFA